MVEGYVVFVMSTEQRRSMMVLMEAIRGAIFR